MAEELEPDVKLEPLEEDEKPLIVEEDEGVSQLSSCCLICNEAKTRKIGDLDDFPSLEGCQGNGSINRQLWSLFILQKLVQFPKEKMADLLEDSGGGRLSLLSDWFVLCENCGEIVKEAMKVFQKILKLETRLKSFQEKVKRRITNSLEAQWNRDTGDNLDLSVKIRDHFKVKGNPNYDMKERNEASDGDVSDRDDEDPGPERSLDNSDDDLDTTDPLYIPPGVINEAKVTNSKKSSFDRRLFENNSYHELMRRQRNKQNKRLATQARKGVQITCKICLSQQIYTNSASYQRHMKDHRSSTTHPCPKCKFPCCNERALRSHLARNCKPRGSSPSKRQKIVKLNPETDPTLTVTTPKTFNDNSSNPSIKSDQDDDGEYPERQHDNSDDDLDKTDSLYIPPSLKNVADNPNSKKSSLDRRLYKHNSLRSQRNKRKKRLEAQARKGVQITCKICLSQQIYFNVASYQRHMRYHLSSTTHPCPKCKFPCLNEKALRSHLARNCKSVGPSQSTRQKIVKLNAETNPTLTATTPENFNENLPGPSIKKGNECDYATDDDDEDWPLVNETEDDDDDVPVADEPQIPKAKPQSIQKISPTNSIPSKEFSCKICLSTCVFATSWSFARHKQQHKLSKFPCPKCRYPCQTNFALKLHLRGKQCNKRACYKCVYCDFTTDINLKFIQHKSIHRKKRQVLNLSDKKNYKGCNIRCKICLCDRVYTNMGSYLRHLNYHEFRRHPCPKCNYPCQSEEALKAHQSRNQCNLKKEYQCDLCDWKSTESKIALNRHRLEVHQKKNKYIKKQRKEEKKIEDFKCTYCPFKTTQQCYLSEHVKRHELYEGEKIDGKIKCKFCDTLCVGPLNLRRHVRENHFEQLGLPLFKCSTCGKNFSRKNDLKFHMAEAHTKQFRFYCEICGFGTMRKSEFTRHITYRHSDEKKFVCEFCAAPFKTDVNLKTHLKKVHGPGRESSVEYFCKYCVDGSNKFSNKSLLDRHLKDRHKDLYVHKCDECENSYLSLASLQLHKKVNHSGEKAECQFCGSKVLNRVYLYGHYKICQKKPPNFKYKYPRN